MRGFSGMKVNEKPAPMTARARSNMHCRFHALGTIHSVQCAPYPDFRREFYTCDYLCAAPRDRATRGAIAMGLRHEKPWRCQAITCFGGAINGAPCAEVVIRRAAVSRMCKAMGSADSREMVTCKLSIVNA